MAKKYIIKNGPGLSTKLQPVEGHHQIVQRPSPLFEPMIPVQEQPLNYILYLKDIMNVPEEHIAKNLAHQIWIRDKLLKKRWDEYKDAEKEIARLRDAYKYQDELNERLQRELQQYRDFGNVQALPPTGGMVFNLKI